MLLKILGWIVLGAIVGWIVSLIMGRDFKGGCLAYVAVGIITMVLLGLLLKLLWVLIIVGLLIVLASWLIRQVSGG